MAEQQTWDDFESLKARCRQIDDTIKSLLKTEVDKLDALMTALNADADRKAALTTLANAHPTYTATFLNSEAARFISLRTSLQNNGYFG